MGAGRGNTYDDRGFDQSLSLGLILMQIILSLICLANFAICIWIRFDLDFWEWVVEIGWYTYWNVMYVVMIAMLLKTFLLGLGVWVVYEERTSFVPVLCILHVLMFVLHLVGAVLVCLYGVEESQLVKSELHDVFLSLVYRWDEDPRASRILRIIQEYVGCCGATGGGDYLGVFKEIPTECRHPVTGNEWDDGCEQALAWWLEPWTVTLAGFSCFICLTDVILVYLYLRLRRQLNSLL